MPTKKSTRSYHAGQEQGADTRAEDLRDEIDMLREIIRLVGQMVDEGRTLEELLDILRTTSIACTRLSTLIKDQQSLAKDDSTALNQALKAVLSDMRAKKTGFLPLQS